MLFPLLCCVELPVIAKKAVEHLLVYCLVGPQFMHRLIVGRTAVVTVLTSLHHITAISRAVDHGPCGELLIKSVQDLGVSKGYDRYVWEVLWIVGVRRLSLEVPLKGPKVETANVHQKLGVGAPVGSSIGDVWI
jgi:hypothetical protein